VIRVSFYGMVRDALGEKETKISGPDSVKGLLEALSGKYGIKFEGKIMRAPSRDLDLIILLNGRHIEHVGGVDAPVKEGDHLAVFPLVGGG
jgi:molybdopterin synthase sulfur carrier subunit